MSKKTFELSDTKAIRVQAIQIGDAQFISLRQLYRKKGQKDWSPARQGISLPLEEAAGIAKFINKFATSDETTFEEVEVRRGSKGEEE